MNYIDPTGHLVEAGGRDGGYGGANVTLPLEPSSGERDPGVAYGLEAAEPGMTVEEKQLAVCRRAATTDPNFFASPAYDAICKVILMGFGTDEDKGLVKAGFAAANFIVLSGIKIEPGMSRVDLENQLIQAGYARIRADNLQGWRYQVSPTLEIRVMDKGITGAPYYRLFNPTTGNWLLADGSVPMTHDRLQLRQWTHHELK